MKKSRNIYFIKPCGFDGPVKIGCSEIPMTRLDQISVWSPWPLELVGFVPGDMADETYLHQCFYSSHLHREWFHSTPMLRRAIKQIIEAGSVDAVRDWLHAEKSVRAKTDRGPGSFGTGAKKIIVQRPMKEAAE